MKYYSDNESIQKAFDKVRYRGILVVILLVIIMSGYFAAAIILDFHPGLAMLFAFLTWIPIVIKISADWFEKSIKHVTDPKEFHERSLRLGLIFGWMARNSVKRNETDLKERQKKQIENLMEIAINSDLVLTNNFVTLKRQNFPWSEVENFKVSLRAKGQNHWVVFQFYDRKAITVSVKTKDIFKVEYLIDKYLNNQ